MGSSVFTSVEETAGFPDTNGHRGILYNEYFEDADAGYSREEA